MSDPWQVGEAYDRYVGRWSRRVAPVFLDWLPMRAGAAWLDVGCGTGALSAAVLEHAAPGRVIGVDPSAGFLRVAEQALGDRVELMEGDAAHLPVADASVDAAVAALVLNFVPDVPAALAECRRVLRPGGVMAGYVWDYAEGMELIRAFFDAAVEVDPDAAAIDEGARFSICHPEPLAAAFAAAGYRDVEVRGIEVETRFAHLDDLWTPFLGGQGVAPAYLMSRPPELRERIRSRLAARLPIAEDGSITLRARAWAVRGTV